MIKMSTEKKYQEYLIDILPIKDLLIDKYQSSINPLRIKRIVRYFDKEQLQPIDVSLRDNKYYIVDGQHRVAALKMLSIKEVLAKVHFYLTYEKEAKLYYELNNPQSRRTPTTGHRWNALLEAKTPKHLDIKGIVASNGFELGLTQNKIPNKIIALAKLDLIYDRIGAEGLDRVLRLIKGSWDNILEAVDHHMLMGVFLFVKYYKDSFTDKDFVKKMRSVSPREIMINAKANRRYSQMAYTPYAKEILFQFNTHKSKKLPNLFPEHDNCEK